MFFLLCIYFNSNLHGLLYSSQHIEMPLYLQLSGLGVLKTVTAQRKNNQEMSYDSVLI